MPEKKLFQVVKNHYSVIFQLVERIFPQDRTLVWLVPFVTHRIWKVVGDVGEARGAVQIKLKEVGLKYQLTQFTLYLQLRFVYRQQPNQ